ncbi:unnamed protein product [Rhizoctonia solani]|nr:unnamed protein product [Rhizoctonia solani]
MLSSSTYTCNTTLTPIHPIPPTTTNPRLIKSMRNVLARLNKTTKERSGGQLAPTSSSSWLGRFSSRCGSRPICGQSAPAKTPAKLGRPQREPHLDPYYGHERTAKMSAYFIHDLFKCSSSFSPGGIPDDTYPSFDKFIAYALSRSESDLDVHYYAMYLIWRMHIKNPELRTYHSHETYLVALMLATKQVVPKQYASETPMSPCLASSESGEEWDYSDNSASMFSVDTPDTTPPSSDSDSPCLDRQKPVGECVWW